MATVAKDLMTAEQLFEWANRPENAEARLHVHRGRVFPMLPPSPDRIATVHVLTEYCLKQGRGEIAWRADGVILDREPLSVVMPDLMLFVDPSNPEDFRPRITTDMPLLMVEVCGPLWSSRALQRADESIRRGVGMVWHLIPEDQELILYLPKGAPKVLGPGDDLTGNGVLPDFWCRVADLFTLPGQPPAPNTAPATP
jgi:Uma2 family endonuclease